MEERKRARGGDNDVPIIGDYSDAQNTRLRPDSPPTPPPPPEQPPQQPARSVSRGRGEQWRPDPSDVRRHARRLREQERERAGPLGKILLYGFVVVLIAAGGAVYWNFDALRSATADFSALPSSFADVFRGDGNGDRGARQCTRNGRRRHGNGRRGDTGRRRDHTALQHRYRLIGS